MQHNASLVTYPNAVVARDVLQIFVTTTAMTSNKQMFCKNRWNCSAAIVTVWLKTAKLLSYFTFVATTIFFIWVLWKLKRDLQYKQASTITTTIKEGIIITITF